MEISRIFIVSIVFLVIWSESFSHQGRKRNQLLKRSRRNHEHDQELGRVKQTNNGKEGKNGPTEIVDSSNTLKAKGRTSNSNLGRYPVNGFVLPRRTIKMKPLHPRNSKGIDNTHNANTDIKKIYVLANKNNEHLLVDEKEENVLVNQINLNESLLNQTSQVDEVEEKKTFVDEILDCNCENAENSSENTVIQEFKKPQIIKLKKPKQKELKTRKSYDIKKNNDDTNHDTAVVKQVHDEHMKNNKNNTLLIVKDTSIERDEIKYDAEYTEDDKIYVDALIEKEQQSKSVKKEDMVVSHEDDELLQKIHPLFKAMQHDIDVNSPSPIKLNVTDSTVKNNETANNNEAFDLDLVKKQLQTEENDDNEGGVIVKKENINEFIEIARTPTVPVSCQQNNHASQYYQVPHQKLSNSGLNDNGIWEANEQQSDQIGGTNVGSYNNWNVPMPANNNYNRYYPYNLNNYRYYGYQGYDKPSMGDVWSYNYCSPNENVKDKVWRSWQNTEYFLKTKNALKQISKEKLYNVVNQNNTADKTLKDEML